MALEFAAGFESVEVELDAQGVAWVTFDRPEKRNALDLQMVQEVRAALQGLAGDEGVRAVVFRGAGGQAFISGADIAQLRERTHADALARINSDLFREIERFPAPTIAAIQGWCLGGGCELALACDLRVAGEGAKLGQPEVGLGIIPAAGSTYRLPRLVGLGRARELIFTGRVVDAAEALEIGLVERVVPDPEVEAAARALAHEIARNGGLAVRLAKLALNQSLVSSLDALQALESTAQGILFDDPEKHRRMTEFLERKQRRGKKAAAVEAPGFELRGALAAPRRFTREDLAALPPEAQVLDVAALVPGRSGRAARLAALLDAAGADPASNGVVHAACGGFSYPQTAALLRAGLVVYEQDGAPLSDAAGGPFRLLIPGCEDRCANVKQLGAIELTPPE
ncbi:MAG: enoyl-CoA hydratase-related protein [Planctomycetota bacterium]